MEAEGSVLDRVDPYFKEGKGFAWTIMHWSSSSLFLPMQRVVDPDYCFSSDTFFKLKVLSIFLKLTIQLRIIKYTFKYYSSCTDGKISVRNN